MRQRRRAATANDSKSSKVHRQGGYFTTAQIKPEIFTLLRCTSTEFIFHLLNTCPWQGRLRATVVARRGLVPQAHAAQQRFKHAPAPLRSSGQGLELVESTSPRALPCHCADKAGNNCVVSLHICRLVHLLLRQHCGATGNGLGTTIKYLRRATSGATAAWAPLSSTCDAQRAAPRETAWAQR